MTRIYTNTQRRIFIQQELSHTRLIKFNRFFHFFIVCFKFSNKVLHICFQTEFKLPSVHYCVLLSNKKRKSMIIVANKELNTFSPYSFWNISELILMSFKGFKDLKLFMVIFKFFCFKCFFKGFSSIFD